MKKYLLFIFLFACSRSEVDVKRSGGLIPDSFVQVDKVPVIASELPLYRKGKPLQNYDSDGDGIINKNDQCPNEPETYNGYLDEDGCPDEITIIPPPPPPPTTPSTEISLKMPPVGSQGSEGSCVPFAVGYAARSAAWFYQTGASSYSNSINIFSPEFLYNQTTYSQTDCSIGTSIQTVLDLMKLKGVTTFQSMPYSSTNGCSLQPTSSQFTEALQYKISGYSKIAFTDRAAIKSMINQKHPVIIAILADNSFINAGAGFIWKTFSGSGMLAHVLVICGYDDTKSAYKVMNSWGATWGDGGFGFIDYNFFETGGRTAGSGWTYVIN